MLGIGQTRPGSGRSNTAYTILLTVATGLITIVFSWLVTQPIRYNFFLAPLLLVSTFMLIMAMVRPLWLFPLMALGADIIFAISVGGANFIPADAAVIFLLLAWVGPRSRRYWPRQGQQVLVPFVLLIAFSIVTLAYSQNVAFGVVKVVQLVEFLLLFLLTISMLREPRWMSRTLIAYVVSAAILAGAVIVFTATNGIHSAGANILFFQKNGIGIFVLMALTTVSAVLLYRTNLSYRQRIFWIGMWANLLAGVILSGSRGAWLGYIVGLLVLILPKGRAFVVRALVVMAIALIVANGVLPQELARSQEYSFSVSNQARYSTGGSTLVRLVIWRDALGIIAAHPLTGVGVGGYISYDTYQGDTLNFNTNDPHNMVLYEWAELGAIGLVIFLWFIGAVLRLNWRAFARAQDAETRWLAGAAFASLTGYLTMSLTEPFWTRGDGLIFFLLVGMVVNLASPMSMSRTALVGQSSNGLESA